MMRKELFKAPLCSIMESLFLFCLLNNPKTTVRKIATSFLLHTDINVGNYQPIIVPLETHLSHFGFPAHWRCKRSIKLPYILCFG